MVLVACGSEPAGPPNGNDPPPAPSYPPAPLTPDPDVPPVVVIDGTVGLLREGNAVDTIVADPQLTALSAHWSPDGARIAFTAELDDPGSQGPPPRRVFVVDSTGANRLMLVDVWARSPRWSPDGTEIAYHTVDSEIWIGQGDGSAQRRLTSVDPAGRRPDWAPDGASLVYVGEDDQGREGLFRVATDDSGRELVLERTVTVATERAHHSPDGSRLLWEVDGELLIMNADGTGVIPLTGDDVQGPFAWSPDGSLVALNAAGNVQVVNGRSGAVLDIFVGAGFMLDNLSWSPDGTRLTFADGGSIAIGALGAATRWSVVARGSWVAWHPSG